MYENEDYEVVTNDKLRERRKRISSYWRETECVTSVSFDEKNLENVGTKNDNKN